MSPSRVVLLSASVILCFLAATPATFSAGRAAPLDRPIEPEERPLPPGAIARLGSLRLRHEHEVRSIAFSPDGKKIASVSQYGRPIRVWETATGKLLHEIDPPGPFLAFTPDGKSIAARP